MLDLDNKFFYQSSTYEKCVLMLSSLWGNVLSTFAGRPCPYTKVDVVYVTPNNIYSYSYNNGYEVNAYYWINLDEYPYYAPIFIYDPNVERFPELIIEESQIKKIDYERKSDEELIELLTKVYLNWSLKTQDEYCRDMLSHVYKIQDLEDGTRVFATLIGYYDQWAPSTLIIPDILFAEFIDYWKFTPAALCTQEMTFEFLIKMKRSLDPFKIIQGGCERLLCKYMFYNPCDDMIYIDAFVDTINTLAMATYERAENKGKIAFVDGDTPLSENYVELVTPLLFYSDNAREIRKLLETTCVENFFLLVKQGYVVGILFSDGIDNYLSFSGMGKWSLHINKKPALIASGNKCSLYKNIKSIDFKKEYACCFGLDEVPPNIYTIVEIATKQKHGTALVICDDADEEADRLCKLKRGMRIYPLVLEDEESFKYVESITAMDGALLLDPLGVCHAVSVILDGDAVIPGSTARGARYNSICNYVERQSRKKGVSSLGIIISEDGSVDLCAASGGNG